MLLRQGPFIKDVRVRTEGKGLGQKQTSVLKLSKGPFIKDVRTKGGRGVSPKADIVREVAWIYSYRSDQNADKRGEGVQNPENFADVLYV